MTAEPEAFNAEQAAKRLGVSAETVRVWAREGQIGHVKIGRYVRFTQKEIDEYIDRHRVPPARAGRTARSRAHHRR